MSDPENTSEPLPLDPEFLPYATMIDAINAAMLIRADLKGTVPGALKDYIIHAQQKAATALKALCVVPVNDPYEIMRLQKEIAAYADVMGWIGDRIEAGNIAEADYSELQYSMKELE